MGKTLGPEPGLGAIGRWPDAVLFLNEDLENTETRRNQNICMWDPKLGSYIPFQERQQEENQIKTATVIFLVVSLWLQVKAE